MADIEGLVRCAACGRQLPPQQGRGRRRRYCDATCRSAARRARELSRRAAPGYVKAPLTTDERHVKLDIVSGLAGTADPVASTVRETAGRLAEELTRPWASSPLAAMAAAQELSSAADAALQATVDRARAAGHSWKSIGDVLGTTRQAAFQRFGRPVDPRTGEPMTRVVPPGLAERAVAIFNAQANGRWQEVIGALDQNMRERLDADRMAAGWTHTIALIGSLERIGEPVAVQAGDYTLVNIPLHFEAGEANGRVTFDRAGQVAGLFIRPA
jgi:hypothetical protein